MEKEKIEPKEKATKEEKLEVVKDWICGGSCFPNC